MHVQQLSGGVLPDVTAAKGLIFELDWELGRQASPEFIKHGNSIGAISCTAPPFPGLRQCRLPIAVASKAVHWECSSFVERVFAQLYGLNRKRYRQHQSNGCNSFESNGVFPAIAFCKLSLHGRQCGYVTIPKPGQITCGSWRGVGRGGRAERS